MVFFLRYGLFVGFFGLGLWGLVRLAEPWGLLALIGGFVAGGVTSRLIFKRFATPEEVKAELEARLHND
ncbi:MAG: hypothetical protein AAF553_01600 [Pseudomonadota bacterium]